ncbi:MAG TPA: hypothetical protein VF730_08570 [Terracidiphilus sp.]
MIFPTGRPPAAVTAATMAGVWVARWVTAQSFWTNLPWTIANAE